MNIFKNEIKKAKKPLCNCRKYTPVEIYMCKGFCVICGKKLKF